MPIPDSVKWLVGIVGSLALFAVYLVVQEHRTQHVLGFRVASIDETSYVAANNAALDSVPIFRQLPVVNTYTIGITAMDAAPFHETGPPYDHYISRRAFHLPVDSTCD